jgi:hypothetical protein
VTVNDADRAALQRTAIRAAQLSETTVFRWFEEANWTNPGRDGVAHFLLSIRQTAAIHDELLKVPTWPSLVSRETVEVTDQLLRSIARDIALTEERLAKYRHVPAWALSTRNETAGILNLKAIAEQVESLHDAKTSCPRAGQIEIWQPHARHLSATLDEMCPNPRKIGSRARLIRLALAAIGISQTEDAITKTLSRKKDGRRHAPTPVRTRQRFDDSAQSTVRRRTGLTV